MANARRVHFLDELRGVLIIYVVVYHLLFDLAVLFPVSVPWMFSPWMNQLRDVMTGTLIVISGISCNYSRSNMRRGAKTFGWGMVITLATVVLMPSQTIIFGILHFFGASMMLYALLEKPISHIPAVIGVPASILLYFFTQNIYYGSVGLFGYRFSVPDFFYNKLLLYPFGFRCQGVSSGDYYPILPWIFLFFAGSFLGRWLRDGRFPNWVYRPHIPLLGWIGSHTLPIYLIHQPVIYGVLYAVFYLI